MKLNNEKLDQWENKGIYFNIQPIWGQHRQNTQEFGKEMTTYINWSTLHTERDRSF